MTAKEAVKASLCYFDYFTYPLKAEEVWLWAPAQLTLPQVKKALKKLVDQGQVTKQENYYFLPQQKQAVLLRKQKEAASKRKYRLLRRRVKLLKHLGVKFFGISGSLALKAAGQEDDIDLLVVNPAGQLWWKRFCLIIVTTLLGWRRRPGQASAPNKLCFNIFLAEDHLGFSSGRQNIYTAHELLQLKPIWDPHGTYKRLLQDNRWTKDFLPQAYQKRWREVKNDVSKKDNRFFPLLEKAARIIQKIYMKKRGEEEIKPGQLFFHPENKSAQIVFTYKNLIKKVNNEC